MILKMAEIKNAEIIKKRFWIKVTVKKPDECWLWNAGKWGKKWAEDSTIGYGNFRVWDNRITAHRFAYLTVYGEIPKGIKVLHTCDEPLCCNPKHLWVGTQADNVTDMHRKGRAASVIGVKNPRAILTESDVLKIAERISKGESNVEIACDYGVSNSTIWQIRKKNRWQHLFPE